MSLKYPYASELIRKKAENITYDGLSWRRPRTVEDYIVAIIQSKVQDKYFGRMPNYAGLLDQEEKKLLEYQRSNTRAAYNILKPDPLEASEKAMLKTQYKEYSLSFGKGVSGNIFTSDALRKKSKPYDSDGKSGRVSFSVNLSNLNYFYEDMMEELIDGSLANVPVKLKVDNALPYEQGNGENAHLYFNSAYEKEVYRALVDEVYPHMLKRNMSAVGGRFLMIPILDDDNKTLRGVEFGQDLKLRSDMQLPKRQKIIADNGRPLATSDIITDVMIYTGKLMTPEMNEKFKSIYNNNGRSQLLKDQDFTKIMGDICNHYRELGRMERYPILDRDALYLFPNFTKAIKAGNTSH